MIDDATGALDEIRRVELAEAQRLEAAADEDRTMLTEVRREADRLIREARARGAAEDVPRLVGRAPEHDRPEHQQQHQGARHAARIAPTDRLTQIPARGERQTCRGFLQHEAGERGKAEGPQQAEAMVRAGRGGGGDRAANAAGDRL